VLPLAAVCVHCDANSNTAMMKRTYAANNVSVRCVQIERFLLRHLCANLLVCLVDTLTPVMGSVCILMAQGAL
jgi:hypothetical protein